MSDKEEKEPTEEEIKRWWQEREEIIEKTCTETPTLEKYILTIEAITHFTPENDGVHNARELEEWLKYGDVLSILEEIKIIKVRKVVRNP